MADLDAARSHSPDLESERPEPAARSRSDEFTELDPIPAEEQGGDLAASTGQLEEKETEDRLPDVFGWGTVMTLVLALFLANAVYLALFSEIGFGATLFKALMRTGNLYVAFGGLGVILLIIFYIVDFDTGSRPVNIFVCTTVAGCMVFAAVLCFSQLPHAPLMAFMVTACAYFVAIYVSAYKGKISAEGYIQALSRACLIGGFAGLAASCVWAAINNCWWGTECKKSFNARLRVCRNEDDCERYGTFGTQCRCTFDPNGPDAEGIKAESACDPTEDYCLAAFMLWASPFLMSVMMFVFGLAMHFISSAAIDAHVGKAGESKAANTFRIFRMAVLFLVFVLYIGASVAGASMQLSNVVVSFAFLGLLLLAIVMALASGVKKAKQAIKDSKIVKNLTQDPFWSNVAKGLALCVGSPVFLFFLPVAYLKRSVRKMRAATTRDEEAGACSDRNAFKEVLVFRLIEQAKSWEWTTILKYAWVWGFAYFAMQAMVMTMTTLFMAWLNIQLAGLHWAIIAVIIMGIGLILFAIPVVPGVPAYLACGVILGAAEPQFGSFALTMIVGSIVATVTKLLACLMQQKIFGELLGRQLWVRSTLGVNDPTMKAINLILQEKGLTMGKVAILVGGPDWPTSVLTGVLKCSALQMQMGTLPVSIPIIMIVLTGGAMLKTGELPDSLWVPLSGVFMTISAALQAFIGLLAIKYVNQTIKERADEVAAIPDDDEVKQFDESQKQTLAEKAGAMQWGNQSRLWRAVLILSVVNMVLSCWIFKLFTCFEDVVLTTDIREEPFNNQFLNVFRLYGWVGLCFQVVSWFLYWLFDQHIKAAVKANKAQSRIRADALSTSGDDEGVGAHAAVRSNRVDQEPPPNADVLLAPSAGTAPDPSEPPAAVALPADAASVDESGR